MDYEQLMAHVRRLEAEGRVDEARQVAQIAAREFQRQQQPARNTFQENMSVVNESIARGLGAPVDIVSSGLEAVGIGGRAAPDALTFDDMMARSQQLSDEGRTEAAGIVADIANRTFNRDEQRPFDILPNADYSGYAPVGGSESIRRLMEATGSDPSRRDPEGFGENVLAGAGEAAGMLLPLGAVGNALQRLGPVAAKVGQIINRPFTSTPTRAVATEMGAGAGFRVGEEYARGLSESETGKNVLGPIGGLVGGLMGSVVPSAAMRTGLQATRQAADAAPVVGSVIRGVRAAVTPFTESGARVRAQDRVRDLVADPEATARAMQGENIGDLTPAQMANDPNLLSLERTAMDQDPRLRDDLLARQRSSQDLLSQELMQPAQGRGAEETQQFLAQRQQAFRENLEGRAAAAQERAQERIMQLDPARRATENSVIVREELDRAYDAASAQERALWGNVPRNAEVPVSRSREVLQSLLDDTPAAQRKHIPEDAIRFLSDGGFDSIASVNEMHGLYSELRRVAREALGQTTPNENRARMANMVADAILEDLGTTAALPTRAAQAINQARAFSAEMNQVFNQGTVGELTAVRRSGGDAVPPELTLQRAIGGGGDPAAVAASNIRRAAGPSVDPAMEDFLRGRLTDRTLRQGEYSPQRGEDFIRANRELLTQYPELQGDIGAANIAANRAREQQQRVDEIIKRLESPRETVSTAFIRATPGNEIAQAVFQSRNPAAAANSLAQAARRDQSGAALDGLKGAFLDHLMTQSSGRFDTEGVRLVSGNQLFGNMQDPGVRGALNRVFEPQEIARMERIARQFQGLEGARNANAFEEMMNDMPNAVIEMAGRVLAARQGAALGGTAGGSLQTAQMASSRMKKVLGRLTNDRATQLLRDAVTDRDLFVSLLTRADTPAQRAQVEARFIEWMVGVGAVSTSELNEWGQRGSEE